MTWARLDDGFHSDPKILAIGNDGAGVFARALSYCGDHLTDGFVPLNFARNLARKPLRFRLERAGIWTLEEGGYRITNYLNFNPSRAEVEAERARKQAAGRAGARKRWHSSSHSTSHGTPSGNRIAGASGGSDAPIPYPYLEDLEGSESIANTDPNRNRTTKDPGHGSGDGLEPLGNSTELKAELERLEELAAAANDDIPF